MNRKLKQKRSDRQGPLGQTILPWQSLQKKCLAPNQKINSPLSLWLWPSMIWRKWKGKTQQQRTEGQWMVCPRSHLDMRKCIQSFLKVQMLISSRLQPWTWKGCCYAFPAWRMGQVERLLAMRDIKAVLANCFMEAMNLQCSTNITMRCGQNWGT